MKWSDVSPDGVWTVREEPRAKGTGGALQLAPLALKILAEQPRLANNDYVFFARIRDHGPTTSFDENKKALDRKSGVVGWVLHDARRVARSLMARAGVPDRVAELVLGHRIAGVEGIYNVHDYADEKAAALAKLAALIEAIVRGEPGGNVVPLRQPAAPHP
jgi:integrase